MLLNNLFESAKDQYLAMLPQDVANAITGQNGINFKKEWEDNVNWATNNLKKQDRVVWYLKIAKFKLLDTLRNHSENKSLIDMIDRHVKKLLLTIDSPGVSQYFAHSNLSHLQHNLQHFLSLNLPKINNIVFQKQTPQDIFAEMASIEKEWKDRQKSVIPHNAYEPESYAVVIHFPDGYEWVDLYRAHCSIEAKAMGHCGNSAAYKSGETILSLREPVQGGWVPHCTFILNTETGTLGEMKGRGNEKPAKKYHPYILKLLELPIINKIRGGGYKPEANFSIGDLTSAQQEELFEKKPELAGFGFRFEKYGITADLLDDVDNWFGSRRGFYCPEYVKGESKNGMFVIETKELSDIRGSDPDLDDLCNIFERDDYYIDHDAEILEEITNFESIDFLKSLPDDVLTPIRDYTMKKYEKEIEAENQYRFSFYGFNLDDAKDLYKILEENEDPIIPTLQKSIRMGHKAFLDEKILSVVQSYMWEPIETYHEWHYEDLDFTLNDKDSIEDMSTTISIYPRKLFELMDNGELEERGWDLDQDKDFSSWFKDFTYDSDEYDDLEDTTTIKGFDQQAAISYLLGEFPQFVNKEKELATVESIIRESAPTAVYASKLPDVYRDLPKLGKGMTSIVLDKGDNTVLMFTRDPVKEEWLTRPWGIKIGKTVNILKNFPHKKMEIRDMPVYVIQLPKLYPLDKENKRKISKEIKDWEDCLAEYDTTEKGFNWASPARRSRAMVYAINVFKERYPNSILAPAVEFMANYVDQIYSDFAIRNTLQDSQGNVVVIDPLVSRELLDAMRRR